MKSALQFALGFSAIAHGSIASSQDYPVKPIQIVSESIVGSVGDTAIRLVARKMSDNLGQQVVVENRPGAQGAIAAAAVKKAAPDGYTMFYSSTTGLVNARFLVKNRPYDSLKDFSPVSAVIGTASFMVVNADVPANSVKELVELARRDPGKYAYGSTGMGSLFHLYGESIKYVTGTDMTHVPYNAGNVGAAVNDILSGRIQAYFMSYSVLRTQLKTGKVRVLATMNANRYKRLPEVPSMTEALPNYQVPPALYALLAPLGTSKPNLERLSAEVKKGLLDPDVSGKLDELGIIPVGTTPDELTTILTNAIDVVGKITSAIGLKPE
ncbi:MAG: Bug family tripartite tricarboxylate transporter substrate binding protein [Burkholderiales bacterium]